MSLVPIVVDKEGNNERSYDIFSRLLKDRIIFISGEITDQTANSVIAELLFLDSIETKDISIYINSPGGSVTAGLAIYDTMNYINSDVSTVCVGLAASMGAFLLLSGQKGKRYALENSEIMIHQPLGGVEGQATEIKIAAERILKTREKLNQIISQKTNQKLKKIQKDTERDYFLSSIEAKEYGIIDKIITKKEKCY
ncbi:MAG: ATP-dependent Clp protease proteolytic subunit [Bacilli bacterium]|nr:ATP-dependent Clp protease proteolytic subunit [Bacilli bacterium]